ncbi:hypothetical protein C8J57DRAFT_1344223, partial [Mycena rebaudengoi]
MASSICRRRFALAIGSLFVCRLVSIANPASCWVLGMVPGSATGNRDLLAGSMTSNEPEEILISRVKGGTINRAPGSHPDVCLLPGSKDLAGCPETSL